MLRTWHSCLETRLVKWDFQHQNSLDWQDFTESTYLTNVIAFLKITLTYHAWLAHFSKIMLAYVWVNIKSYPYYMTPTFQSPFFNSHSNKMKRLGICTKQRLIEIVQKVQGMSFSAKCLARSAWGINCVPEVPRYLCHLLWLQYDANTYHGEYKLANNK